MAVFMCLFIYFFFFKQKTAYEMRIIDWSSDVCSSDLLTAFCGFRPQIARLLALARKSAISRRGERHSRPEGRDMRDDEFEPRLGWMDGRGKEARSEEHTSELQSLMRISYAVFCLKKKKK